MHRSLLLAALLAVTVPQARAQTPTEVPADIIIPQPAPSAPASAWVDAPGRKRISFTSAGVELHGFRYEGPNPRAPEVLFFNGNGMTILRTDPFYRQLAAQGASVTVYDYRGYGFSAGKAHVADFREDGLRLYDEAVKAAPSHKVVVYGASLGTATAAYIASQRPVAGLILGMPIASVEEEFQVYGRLLGYTPEALSHLGYSAETKAIFAESTMIKASQAPLLVLGGSNDQVVPEVQAKEVFAASPVKAKTFVDIPGAGHNDVIASRAGLKAVESFLKTVQ